MSPRLAEPLDPKKLYELLDPKIKKLYESDLNASIDHLENDIKEISKPINKKYWGQIIFIVAILVFNLLTNYKGLLGNIDFTVLIGTIGIDISSFSYTGKELLEVFKAKGRDIKRLKRTIRLLRTKLKHIRTQPIKKLPRLNRQITLMLESLLPIDALNIEQPDFSDIVKAAVEDCANIARKNINHSDFDPP